jgi:hypothetical protein
VGYLNINLAMFEVIQDDDQLAAILGREILHMTLAHELDMVRIYSSWWYRLLARTSNTNAMPLLRGPNNFSRELAEWIRQSRRESHEKEAVQVLPALVANAGFDPWSIIAINKRILALDIPPVFFDGLARTQFAKTTDEMEQQLINARVPIHFIHSSETIDAIHSLLKIRASSPPRQY